VVCGGIRRGGYVKLEIPLARGFVPDGRGEAMTVLDSLSDIVLLGNGFEIAVDLDAADIVSRVIWVRLCRGSAW
jgi:hypothetical protein